MAIKETDTEIIFVEVLKKETLYDLLHFGNENGQLLAKFGIKNDYNHIADALTKLISTNIKTNILQYIETLIETSNGDDKNGDSK
jgi:hypothetical protein